MALTITPVKTFVVGDRKCVIADVLFDNSYASGGEVLTGADLGLDLVLDSVNAGAATTGHVCPYDYTNQKLMAFNGTTQIVGAVDLSAVKTRVVAIGKGKGL